MDKTVPLGRVKGTLTPPCSKSYAQRALAASLLCGETSVLRNLEFCDDTRSALRCIETLGARVKHVDASTLSIEGGLHPRGKVLHVGESGLATRLFTPIASLCGMPVTIEGQGTLLRRPMHMMIDPLRRLGVRVRDNDGYLPFEVRGPIRGGEIDVDGSVSSQFITGLLLALPLSQHDTTLHVRSAVSTPYLDMTVDTAARFGVEICHNDYKEFYIEGGQRYRPAFFSIEGDWSAAAMLLVAGAVAGVVAKKMLPPGIAFDTRITEIGGCTDPARFDEVLRAAAADRDSVGGIIECRVQGVPLGLGQPFFDSAESLIAHLLFAVPAVKGVEFGSGFAGARMRGSQNNDPLLDVEGTTATNNAGGINGGITNGNEIVVRAAVKPTPSIGREQNTYNLATDKVEPLTIRGRHDVCVALRGAVVAEAAVAIALANLIRH